MIKECLSVISTRNPTEILLENITNLKKLYPEFDILVVDSCSDINFKNIQIFKRIPSDVMIAGYNKNYELGAWAYALRNYPNYKQYMFIQDTLVPISRTPNGFDIDTFYSFHYEHYISAGGHFERLQDIYRNTDLDFISKLYPTDRFVLSAHSSFIANAESSKKIVFSLETPYEDKKITKSKIDSWLSERTCGLLAHFFGLKRIDAHHHGFRKTNGGRM